MKPSSITTTLPLAHKATLRIDNPAGLSITAAEGSLWLTFDGQQRDIILTAGTASATFVADSRTPALVYALADARVCVATASACAASTQCASVHARSEHENAKTLLPLAAA